MKVYLAGGMRSDWRDQVKAVSGHTYIDPTQHKLEDAIGYTFWDLAAVESCDLVFAYMEKDNPSGVGMVLEIGYALGLGKKVIFVDEQNNKYFAIVRESVSALYDTLDK